MTKLQIYRSKWCDLCGEPIFPTTEIHVWKPGPHENARGLRDGSASRLGPWVAVRICTMCCRNAIQIAEEAAQIAEEADSAEAPAGGEEEKRT